MIRSHWRLAGTVCVLSLLASTNLPAQTETFTYDDLGRLVIVEHGDNKSSNFDLDPAGNRKNVQTSDATPPTVPANLNAAAASSTQINVTWTASTDNVGVTKYRIERCQGASCTTFSHIASPAGTSYSDTVLNDITSFTYRLRAGDAGGNWSGYSATDTETTPDGTPPTAPANLNANVISATQINLSWTSSTDNVAVQNYIIQRCTGVGCSNYAQIGTSVNPNYSNTLLSDITTYRYRVRARDAIPNFSDWSSVVTATTPDGTAPSTPTGFTATAVAFNQASLAWTASTDNVAVTGYRVERCTGSGCSSFVEIAAPTATSYSDTPISGSTTYRYRVRANDAIPNLSGYTAIRTITTPAGVPVAPVISPSTLLKKVAGESYTISWNSVAGATSYDLFQNGSSVWTGTATSRNFPSAVIGNWLYTVKACNASGCSVESNGRMVQVCATQCP